MEFINDYKIENLGDTYFIERNKNPHFRIAVDIKGEPEIIRIDLIDKRIKVTDLSERLSEIEELLKIIIDRHK